MDQLTDNTESEIIEPQKRNTIPQLDPGLPSLAEAYADSYEKFKANSEKRNSTLLFIGADQRPFLERIELWAAMVICGAALREQSLPKKIEEQNDPDEKSGRRTLPSVH